MNKIKVISLIFALLFAISGCRGDGGVGDNISKLESGDLIVLENENKINIAAGSFDTFNPIMTKSVSVAEFMKVVCEPLFEYDEKGNPIAVLAENYAVSANGMTVSFNVAGVPFHDGTTLSAGDVVYTVNMIRENDTIYNDAVKYIKEIYADANGTVYIRLTQPVVNFAGMLNFPIVKNGTPMVVDEDFIPIGTGAFKYHGKGMANQIIFISNPDWHGGNTGYKSVIVNLMKDSDTAIHAFDAGTVDVISTELFKGSEITPRGDYAENSYTSNALTFLGLNNSSNKLAGKATRRALEMLIDRDKLVSVELYSKGTPARFPINPTAWFYPDIAEGKRDYSEAESLLAADGWVKQGEAFFKEIEGTMVQFTLKILVNRDSDEKMRIAESLASVFNSFGIPTELRATDFETYKINVTDKSYDIFIGEVITDKGMLPAFLTASGDNYFGYASAEMDGIVTEMACTADPNVILEKAKRYGEIFSADMPFIPLFFRKESVIYNKNISGIAMPTNYSIYRDLDKWYASKLG